MTYITTCPPNGVKCQQHVVRLQAQGGRTEKSVTLVNLAPITVYQGVVGLRGLANKLTAREREQRAVPLRQAEAFIKRGPPSGIAAVVRQTFEAPRARGVAKGTRVDVEILRGVNFRR